MVLISVLNVWVVNMQILLIILILIIPNRLEAQPLPCTPGDGTWNITTTTASLNVCNSNGLAWLTLSNIIEGIPTGLITLVSSGTCPTGWTEATELNGVTLVGTLAANGNVGTTGGNNNITPSGTNSALTFTGSSANTNGVGAGTPAGTNSVPIFTGNVLSNHAHELPLHGGTTPRITAGYGTGPSIAGTRSLTNAAQTTAQVVLLSQAVTAGTPTGTVTAPTFTGTPLGTHQHSLTATGTINTPVFTGTQFDNRSAFKYVIFCKKT